MDLAWNNLQRLICHKTQTTNNQLSIYSFNYCYLTLIILCNIKHLFVGGEVIISIAIQQKFNSTLFIHLYTVKWSQVVLFNTNNSI